jgi:hypothetical protein
VKEYDVFGICVRRYDNNLSALLNYVRNSVAGNCEYSDNFDQQSIIV